MASHSTILVSALNLSYQVNAWGRVSKNVETYREQAQASAADLAVINLSLHATLAVDYFAARSLDAEEKLLQDTVGQYQQAYQLNEDRYEGGLASEVEVEQARTILETTRAQMIDVGVARSQFEHAVAVLVGKPPAEFSLPRLCRLTRRRHRFLLACLRSCWNAGRCCCRRAPGCVREC